MRTVTSFSDNRSKVTEVTLAFWIVKILATSLGETGGDAVTTSMSLGFCVARLRQVAA
jgi:uncharacterized membrane-anchored protein